MGDVIVGDKSTGMFSLSTCTFYIETHIYQEGKALLIRYIIYIYSYNYPFVAIYMYSLAYDLYYLSLYGLIT